MNDHLRSLREALARVDVARVEAWGVQLCEVLRHGGRLLACGNGGSAAEAQHLTAELVGRFEDERRPLSAIALHADTSSLTAITNDYGAGDAYARQVRAHGRPGDVLICLSTSGTSRNVVAAAAAARETGMVSWALTGPEPNPLATACDAAVAVPAARTATVQEVHLALVHVLCGALDAALRRAERPAAQRARDSALAAQPAPTPGPRTAAARERPHPPARRPDQGVRS
ncbi:D-sedoheptulose-7-phosphate isomerase [Allonocardiopsis opalescens]|uniref:Phosphoheptose isomerase n=1 Tax=Allonocardiopsis opalescens TaxID=1144618 RepID=A0A2T0PXQ4_9ACTN|nr:phosphoheptose isomerase [Allonocardiopsis opalescens]